MDTRSATAFDQRGRGDGFDARVAAEEANLNSFKISDPMAEWSLFLRDALKMADLQLQLLSLDIQQFYQEARTATIFAVCSGLIAIASLPVLLLGICQLLVQFYGWSLASACIGVGGLTLVAACAVVGWATGRVLRAGKFLDRSRSELSENLKWMRDALHDEHQ